MALRNQPYLPLYVQDFLTDEKLAECSAQSTGVFIRIMCLMHKSEEYGTILLRQNQRQNTRQIENFADKLAIHLPYSHSIILAALEELLELGILNIDGDRLCQKRMIRDNALSEQRSLAGKRGADIANNKDRKKTGESENFADDFADATPSAKVSANTENENENENEIIVKEKSVAKKFKKPTIDEINDYCSENGINLNASKFFNYYESKGWLVGKSPMKNWKAAINTWVTKDNDGFKHPCPPPSQSPTEITNF